MSQIFLSYRRAEHPALIGRIYDRLTSEFGQNSVFLDVDSIPLGIDFEPYLKQQISKCDVFVAIVGKEWLARIDRLHRKDDFIRIEIEGALQFKKPIIPLLVDTEMPRIGELPVELNAFLSRNGMKLDPGQGFHNNMARFIAEVSKTIRPANSDYSPATPLKRKTLGQIIMNVIDEIQQTLEHPGHIRGLTSGFADLDALIDGFHPSGTYVFAAEPGTGLSSLLSSIAQRVLLETESSILWIESDSNEEAVASRLLYGMAALHRDDVRRGLLTRKQQDCLASATRFLQKAKLSIAAINDEIQSFLTEQLHLERSDRPDLIVIDDLSLLSSPIGKTTFLDIVRFAKLARIPLICSIRVPLNKHPQTALDKFKESSLAQEILHAATFVGWLSVNRDIEDDEAEPIYVSKLTAILSKHGRLGEVFLNFWPQYMTFSRYDETTAGSWSAIVKSVEEKFRTR